jgi:hypothetical protein
VFRDGRDLGPSPVRIEVPEGQRVLVQLRAEGYKVEDVALDGSEQRKVVTLEKIAKAQAPRPPPRAKSNEKTAAPIKKKSSIGGGEIVDPWSR